MNLYLEVLNKKDSNEIITIIGSGGKTSTLYRLGEEIYNRGFSALLTTTTSMRIPKNSKHIRVIVESDIKALYEHLKQLNVKYQIFAGKYFVENEEKVKGYKPEELIWLNKKVEKIKMVVEGDGSKGKSLKIPAIWEPVVPESTDITIVVIGWDIIGKPIDEKWIHRYYLLKEDHFLGNNDILNNYVNELMILNLLENPLGLLKGIPSSSSVVLLINKVITTEDQKYAKEMAYKIIDKIPRIRKVLLGEVRNQLITIQR